MEAASSSSHGHGGATSEDSVRLMRAVERLEAMVVRRLTDWLTD